MKDEDFRKIVADNFPYELEMYDRINNRLNQVWITKWSSPAEFDAWRPIKLIQVENVSGTGRLSILAHWQVHCENVFAVNVTKTFDWCIVFTRNHVPFQNNYKKRKALQHMVDYHRSEHLRLNFILEQYKNDH